MTSHYRRSTRLALAVRAALAGLPLVAAPLAAAPAAAELRSYDIPAGPLAGVLSRFAAEAGIPLSVDAALTDGKSSNGLHGSHAVDAALKILLAGTGLEAAVQANGSYTLRQAPEGETTLKAVKVQSSGFDDTTEHSGSYTTSVTHSATKLALSPRETPQTITIVTRQKIEDFGLSDMDDVMESTSTVHVQENSLSRSNKYYSRGFNIQSQYDGVNHPIDITAYESSPDSAFVDHVEILQGASGLLSGAGQPGGTINMVRKLPTAQTQISVEAGAGSWNKRRLVGDVSGPLTEEGALRGRLVALWQEGDSFQDHRDGYRGGFYGVLQADVTPATQLTARIQYQKDRDKPGYGVPTSPTGRDLGYSRSRYFATDWSYMDKESWLYTVGLEQKLWGEWKLFATYDHGDGDKDSLYGNFWSGTSSAIRLGRDQDKFDFDSADVYATGPFELFGRIHELAVGTSIAKAHSDDRSIRTSVPTDIYTFDPRSLPRYDGVPENWYGGGPGSWNGESERRQGGYYAATRINLADSLKVIVGARVSHYRYTRGDTGVRTLNETGVVSPYGGVIYDISKALSAYVSYSDIFNPQNAKGSSGNTLEPVVGSNYEAGIKGEFYDGRLNTAAAVFRLEQENLAEIDDSISYSNNNICGGYCYVAAGLVTSEGVDLSVNGEVLPGWEISAGYTYVDSEYKKGDQKGDPYASYLPEHLLRVFTSHALPGTDWTVGGDVRVQSRVYRKDVTYHIRQGSYTLVGLMAKYRLNDHADINLRLNNLFDRAYYERIGYPIFGSFYGEPRNVMVTLRYRM